MTSNTVKTLRRHGTMSILSKCLCNVPVADYDGVLKKNVMNPSPFTTTVLCRYFDFTPDLMWLAHHLAVAYLLGLSKLSLSSALSIQLFPTQQIDREVQTGKNDL